MRTQAQMMAAVVTACADINRRMDTVHVGVDWNGVVRLSTNSYKYDSMCLISDIPRAFSVEEITEWLETEIAVHLLKDGV